MQVGNDFHCRIRRGGAKKKKKTANNSIEKCEGREDVRRKGGVKGLLERDLSVRDLDRGRLGGRTGSLGPGKDSGLNSTSMRKQSI